MTKISKKKDEGLLKNDDKCLKLDWIITEESVITRRYYKEVLEELMPYLFGEDENSDDKDTKEK